ncbi:hypothetical protein JB92DRAFT_2755677, partial [Gautieria morchelliformis]
LIAEAIVAFQSNNLQRVSDGILPGITMISIAATFFKIPVIAQLDQTIIGGTYPSQLTIVHVFVSQIPRPTHRLSEGMALLNNRRIYMECYELFKQFVF